MHLLGKDSAVVSIHTGFHNVSGHTGKHSLLQNNSTRMVHIYLKSIKVKFTVQSQSFLQRHRNSHAVFLNSKSREMRLEKGILSVLQ